jgi:hypothetical protein
MLRQQGRTGQAFAKVKKGLRKPQGFLSVPLEVN